MTYVTRIANKRILAKYFLHSLQINYLHWKLSASRLIFSCYATYACKLGAGFNNNPLALGYFFKVPPYYTLIGFNLVIHNGGEDVSQSAQDCSMSTEEQEDEQSGQEYEELRRY